MDSNLTCSCGDECSPAEAVGTLESSAPIACDLSQIPADNLTQHKRRAEYLFGEGTQERIELANGFAFRFKADDFAIVADFIAHERLCCPFFNFTIEIQADRGSIWLQITGRQGVKDILVSAFNDGNLWKVA